MTWTIIRRENTMIYDILVAEDYCDKEGLLKTAWRAVGTAFDAKKGGGGVNGKLFPNLAVTGPFIIRPRKERAGGGEASGDTGDDFLE
jgi:hypothetical protein